MTKNSSTTVHQDLPLISIITPVYNGSQYIDELILSVKNQDYPRIEHIIIDDGSTDNGATIAVLSQHKHINWTTRANKGQYRTLNEGLEAATGDWICIISADDLLASPAALSTLIDASMTGGPLDAIYGRTTLMNEAGAEIAARHGRPDESAPKWLNYHFLVIHHCSMLVSREFLVAQRLHFDTSLKYTGDWDWIIRILKNGRTAFADVVVSKYRIHEQQTRQTTARKELVMEDRLILSRHGSSFTLHALIINYYRMKKLWLVFSDDGASAATSALRRFFRKTLR